MTLLSNLQGANLPISAATEDGNSITWQQQPTDAQMQTCRDIVLQYIDPVAYNNLLVERTDIQQIKTQELYQAMITRLENIESFGGVPFTLQGFTQVVNAVKDQATFQKRILKVLKILVKLLL